MSRWCKHIVVLAIASTTAYACAPDAATPADPEPDADRTDRLLFSPEQAKAMRDALPLIRRDWEASPPFPDARPEDIDAFFKALDDALRSPDGEAVLEPAPRFKPDSTSPGRRPSPAPAAAATGLQRKSRPGETPS